MVIVNVEGDMGMLTQLDLESHPGNSHSQFFLFFVFVFSQTFETTITSLMCNVHGNTQVKKR